MYSLLALTMAGGRRDPQVLAPMVFFTQAQHLSQSCILWSRRDSPIFRILIPPFRSADFNVEVFSSKGKLRTRSKTQLQSSWARGSLNRLIYNDVNVVSIKIKLVIWRIEYSDWVPEEL